MLIKRWSLSSICTCTDRNPEPSLLHFHDRMLNPKPCATSDSLVGSKPSPKLVLL